MPEEIGKWIKPEWKVSFLSVLGFGLLGHFYKMTNWLPNWDSLVFFQDSQDMAQFGRIFLSFACGISSDFDLPWLNALLSLFYLGISAACICEIFSLKKKLPAALCGGMLAVFPTTASTLTYNYVADGYFLGFLFMCLAALFLTRENRKLHLAASVCIMLGYGIYQAYITVPILLLLLYLLDALLFQKKGVKRIRQLFLRFLTAGAAGSLLYLAAVQITLKIRNIELSSYQNVNQALTGFRPFYGAKQCIREFLEYFFDVSMGLSAFPALNFCLFLFLGGLAVLAFWKLREEKEKWRSICALFLICCMPFCAYILFFVSPDMEYHNLMVMGHCVFFLIPAVLYERMEWLPERVQRGKQWAILVLSSVILFQFLVIANVSYTKLQMAYWKSYGVAVRIADRIEGIPESGSCRKMAVMGWLSDSQDWYVNLPPKMAGVTDGYLIRGYDWQVEQNVLLSMLKDYCGFAYENVTEEERIRILHSEQFQEMENWPGRNSVEVIDGILVVRMGELIDDEKTAHLLPRR